MFPQLTVLNKHFAIWAWSKDRSLEMEERIWEFSVFTPMGLGDIIWEESREGD